MARLVHDVAVERQYEMGTDHGVLYVKNEAGTAYEEGVARNGLTAVTESPSGAEPTKVYADNIPYVTMFSAEEFGGTIEAFMYPDEFAVCDGSAEPAPGVFVGQQPRRGFGFVYRTKIGNAQVGDGAGYKYHLWYGCTAAPSEKAYATVNDSPENVTFSWEITTDLEAVPGLAKPTAVIVIDTTKVSSALIEDLVDTLYGSATTEPTLPPISEVIEMLTPIAPPGP